MKKLLSLALALALVLTLFAGVSFAEGEKRVLTIADVNDVSDQWNNYKMIQKMKDELNIEIEYTCYDQDGFAAMLASGDLADIVYPDNMLNYIREADLAMNVAPYLEEYCPNALHDVMGTATALYKELMYNGEDVFYFFPANVGLNGTNANGNSLSSRGYVVRWDYYKELGCPKINNDDDYLNVLIQMQANHPTTEEGYPTYLYGTDNWKGYDTAFRSYMNLNYWGLYKYENDIFTNDVFDGYLNPEKSMWWSCTEWQHKLYLAGKDNGTYDMDLFTMTGDEFKVKRERGQYMGMHNGNDDLYKMKAKEDPNTISGYVTVPDAPANTYTNVNMLVGNGSKYMCFISKNSPNWDIALQVINYMYSTDFMREMYIGEKGVTWDYDENGVPQMTEYGIEQYEAFQADKNDESNYYYNLGGRITQATGYNDGVINPKDGYPLNFYSKSREYALAHMNSLYKDVCAWYNVELPVDAVYAAGNFDFRNDCGEAIDSLMSTALDSDQLAIITACEEILESNQADLIMAETQEEYDALKASMLEEMAATGEAEVFASHQEQWNAIRDVMMPLVLQADEAAGLTPYTPEQYNK